MFLDFLLSISLCLSQKFSYINNVLVFLFKLFWFLTLVDIGDLLVFGPKTFVIPTLLQYAGKQEIFLPPKRPPGSESIWGIMWIREV